MTQIAVVGLGYVGCVTAACLAELGHDVTGIDRDAHKVRSIEEGVAPFHEPGLKEIIAEARKAGRLRATANMAEGIREADVVMLCVGTPSESSGNLNLEQLVRVCREIRPLVEARRRPLVVAVRSTVFPGTCEDALADVFGGGAKVKIVSNPEFLREGTAVEDFRDPSLMVVGGEDGEAVELVASLYQKLGVEPARVSLRTAEMIKYACNAFHALKICFANEIGTIAAEVGVDGAEAMATLCRDTRLNISTAYLRPGFAFGGSCLPKDLRAMTYRTHRMNLNLPLLEAILASNERHLERAIARALALPAARIGIYGLAFKENTDDLRESPVVALVEQLIAKGREVRVYDAHVRVEALYGSNLSFLMGQLRHPEQLMAADLDELLQWSEYLIVTQKPGPEDAARIAASGRKVLDVRKVSGGR